VPRGKSGNYRDIDGFLLLDKPAGLSSNQALQRVRRIFRARKAGHCGSLDPLATGLLPVCLGQATRFSGYLLGASKTYRAGCRLGETTTTGDAEGEIVERRPVMLASGQLERVLAGFTGRIEQVPPMHSALKHQGRRLYQLAREGREVERAARTVEIQRLELLTCELPLIEIEVQCSKGTYIRSLAEDIGRELGCGAHLAALRRTAVDSMRVEDSRTLEDLQALAADDAQALDAALMPPDALLEGFPCIELQAAAARDIRHGKRVDLDCERRPGLYRLMAADGDFIGLGEVRDGAELSAKRLMNTAG
jgi:tRNA pseudouridine55 synthase